jgi:hypothetical protein
VVLADVDVVLAATRALRDEVVGSRPRLVRRCFTWRELAWLLNVRPPIWDADADLATRVAELPEVAARSRGRAPAPRGVDLDVEDPAGRRPDVLLAGSDQTIRAIQAIVVALTG